MKNLASNAMRRALIPVLAVLVTAGLSAIPAAAKPPPAAGPAKPFPAVLNLPNGFSPEGLSINDGIAYTGSLANGSIQAIDLKTGHARQLAPSPGAARIAVGMDVDRFGRLWVAGGGPGFFPGVIPSYRVYDTTSGAKLADVTVPDALFLNDVTVTREAAWFTDSFSNDLIRVPIRANSKIGRPEKVTLGGGWAPSAGLNANGIVATPTAST
jgi:streptogramin lyase